MKNIVSKITLPLQSQSLEPIDNKESIKIVLNPKGIYSISMEEEHLSVFLYVGGYVGRVGCGTSKIFNLMSKMVVN